MFITILRANTIKFTAITIFSFLVVAALVFFVPQYESAAAQSKINYQNVYSNSDRIDFIAQFGWNVNQLGLPGPAQESPLLGSPRPGFGSMSGDKNMPQRVSREELNFREEQK